MTGSLNVLLTNDDGVHAQGLASAKQALEALGMTVTVIAPAVNHSCGSHRVSMKDQVVLTRVRGANTLTFSCTGTPADCVRVGILGGLCPVPDVVVSGINHGANAGDDVHYSGTVAAAVEAAMLGYPAVAASQHGPDIGVPFVPAEPTEFPHADYVARIAAWAATSDLPDRLLLNVNLPQAASADNARLALLGRREWQTSRVEVSHHGDDWFSVRPWSEEPTTELGDVSTDFALLSSGVTTVSALSANRGLRDALHDHREALATVPLAL